MNERGEHWDGVYQRTPSTEVSWFQREPTTSLHLIEGCGLPKTAGIVDIGAGASHLADHLLMLGYTDLTVLDVSVHALAEVRARLGPRGGDVSFVSCDVLGWNPSRTYDLWHDRAVFHFLTEPADRSRYAEVAAKAIAPGGWIVLGTFAEEGPMTCSGLPVCRYTPEALAAEFASAFSWVDEEREEHRTPSGSMQPFTWVMLRRKAH